jgi:hypothetical protein
LSRKKKITLGLSAAALAVGLGLGVTGMASATTTPTPTPSASSSAASDTSVDATGKHGRGGDRGQLAADLATKLGVDEAKVTAALQTLRDANKPTTEATGTEPDRAARDAALATSLAAALGVEESTVTTALAEIRTAGQAERAAALKTKLDAAVADATLTQAEADGVTKAVEQGVIGGGR